MDTQVFLVIAAGYFIGSIPFGYLIAKIWNIDIRSYGSGNIGATNVFRTLGPLPGSIVFILDLLKGTSSIYLASLVTAQAWFILLVGLAAILGHTHSIFLKFQGGRGTATALGALLGIAPDIFLGAVVVAALIILITRYVSVASMVTTFLVFLTFLLLKRPFPYIAVAGIATLLIIIRHIPNIKRLLNRTEPKFSV